ncbi:uncharacterized protein LOC135286508 [Passer domesticus]|uniref:uncharacterized protein LOC135286508 n=1 Tax=Passer domesticus TaxID=48849 RepID=UPI0030FF1182
MAKWGVEIRPQYSSVASAVPGKEQPSALSAAGSILRRAAPAPSDLRCYEGEFPGALPTGRCGSRRCPSAQRCFARAARPRPRGPGRACRGGQRRRRCPGEAGPGGSGPSAAPLGSRAAAAGPGPAAMLAAPGPRLLALALALWPAAVTGQVSLDQLPREQTVQEGNAVTFECSMNEDDMSSYYMYWYRQGPAGSLEWIYKEGDEYGEGLQDRFKGRVESSENLFSLQLLAAEPEDAATYYCGAEPPWSSPAAERTKNQQMGKTDHSAFPTGSCSPGLFSGNGRCRKHPSGLVALKGTAGRAARRAGTIDGAGGSVLGTAQAAVWASAGLVQVAWAPVQHGLISPWCLDKLIFGPGTTLTVVPNISKTSDPQVIVMKSKKLEGDGSTGKAACLARNSPTKNISLEMPSQEVVYEQGTSILTSEGLYNAIKVVRLTKDMEVTCMAKFDNRAITAQPEEEPEEPVTGFGEPNRTRTVSEASDRVCNSTAPSAQDPEEQRVNMLSMAVLGLRVLLAKSIAFNALMSIKLFLS